jgi:hypothetical protein
LKIGEDGTHNPTETIEIKKYLISLPQRFAKKTGDWGGRDEEKLLRKKNRMKPVLRSMPYKNNFSYQYK